MKRQWSHLISEARAYSSRTSQDDRSPFERDYDRIIFASPFRRLQDKAQVFPLEHNDFVRTRLTHSLEVSALGRSLGRQVAARLQRDHQQDLSSDDLGTIVAAACLAHDIGNPPFGHHGEQAIRSWFAQHASVLDGLSDTQKADFLHFDGNAQGLRILMFLQSLGHDTGLNLTYTTLATFMKYVACSTHIDKHIKSRKKIGYFSSEAEKIAKMREALHLGPFRHPLAFLMEAADDIAYSVVDIEDGIKKRVLRHDQLLDLLKQKCSGTPHEDLIRRFEKKCADTAIPSIQERASIAVQWLRIDAIGAMFRCTVQTFLEQHDAILAGDFDQELVKVSDSGTLNRALVEIAADHVYCAPEVLALEVFGDRVVRTLLDQFVLACLSEDRKNTRVLEGKLYALVSPSLRSLQEQHTEDSRYDRIQLAVDHICGMTDAYAVAVFERLNGRAG